MQRRTTPAVLALVLAAAGVATAAPASAAPTGGAWQMNETQGSLADSIGGDNPSSALPPGVDRVTFGSGGRGLYFDGSNPVLVADAPALRPGTRDLVLEARLRPVSTGDVNVLQKGQYSPRGHMAKLEIVGGAFNCIFKGSGGDVRVGNATGVKGTARAGVFQVVQCRRSGNQVSLVVNGQVKATRTGDPGTISTFGKPVQIGGKINCPTACDRFVGAMDYARFAIG